jgi:hypothetical protein
MRLEFHNIDAGLINTALVELRDNPKHEHDARTMAWINDLIAKCEATLGHCLGAG